MKALSILGVLLLISACWSVDRNNFKRCDQSSFCRRCRKIQPGISPYTLLTNTLNTYNNYVTLDIKNTENDHMFELKVEAVKDDIFHITIDEKSPLRPRYVVTDALKGPLELSSISVAEKTDQQITVAYGEYKAVIGASPFKIDFFNKDKLVLAMNAKGLMKFEHLRTKPEPKQVDNENGEEEKPQEEEADPGEWEENFKGHHDSKPYGPEAVALDFSFPKASILFGIPEHADSFALKQTVGDEPYRLYNLDVFEYELNNGMALYGAVPVIYGHGPEYTVGVFWQNSAETWVDIHNTNTEKNVMSTIVDFVSGAKQTEPPVSHFMSESGIMDIFVLMGPTPNDAFKQYTDLTGVAPLQQTFALGYHQCRWNYNDEDDIAMVHTKFDEYDIPFDTIWLDIEYTDGKKYFTWDSHKFAHPVEMIQNLTAKGRHLTYIIDPHIKRDSGYFFHNDCTDKGFYVKNKDGNDYEGWCWPGSSSYLDVFNPEVRKFYADRYLLENFKEQTEECGLWNDMNEPSVFNGPEITMLKDNLHFGGWEHRDVHNLYGHMYISASYDGITRRSNGQLRPFILTRSFFAGSQRYAAMWTGDNKAEWSHLEASIKMCLSVSVAGVSFCGADVGGFFGNPDAELMERWYQAGSFQPFFRSHAHIDTKRREPWLFPESTRLIIRDAIRKRYSYISFWYTLFYEHHRSGFPIMRPLLTHYPTDKDAYAIDSEYLLSDKLLVRPVLTQNTKKIDVYFPKKSEQESDWWYDIDTYQVYKSAGSVSFAADSNKLPVFQRGGTIIPKKERIRRAASLMRDDPVSLVVCLDQNSAAKGTLYVDDEKSFEYTQGKYIYTEFIFKDNVLSNKFIDSNEKYPSKVWIERVSIVGLTNRPKSATIRVNGSSNSVVEVLKEGDLYIVRKPGVKIIDSWSITLNY